MKEYIITLDTGTTNTRASLWHRNGRFLGEEKRRAGVRNTAIDGNNSYLKKETALCLRELTEKYSVSFGQVAGVFASGMITSNVGLLEVPHLTAPAGAADFADTVVRAELPELCPVPIYFIRGLKNDLPDWKKLDKMDIMRGEETETLALLQDYPAGTPYVFILPGSHTKFVFVNEKKEITGCLTTLSGELLETVTRNTILADSVERSFVTKETYGKDAVLKGYRAAEEQGFGRAAFSTRIYRMFGNEEERESAWTAGFLLGTVLWNDVRALRGYCTPSQAAQTVGIVAGKEPFATGLLDLISEAALLKEVRRHESGPGPSLSARGAFSIAGIVLENLEQEKKDDATKL